jgi:hypothetical protein
MPVFTPALFPGSMRMALPGNSSTGGIPTGGLSGKFRPVFPAGGTGILPGPTADPRAGVDSRTPWGPLPE